MEDWQEIKKALYTQCLNLVAERINEINTKMKDSQEAAESDSKSSMGDKYETTVAMAHLEREMNIRQLEEALQLQRELLKININARPESVSLGSLVICEQGNYFISVGLGKLVLGGNIYYAISQKSPVGIQLNEKKEGDNFTFNQKTFQIKKIY